MLNDLIQRKRYLLIYQYQFPPLQDIQSECIRKYLYN